MVAMPGAAQVDLSAGNGTGHYYSYKSTRLRYLMGKISAENVKTYASNWESHQKEDKDR